MANTSMSYSEVKKLCSELECSPSQHDASGHQGGAPNLNPTAKSSESVTKNRAGDHTGEFMMSDRGKPLPNYKGQFAKKPQTI
jgi:hypothetical protein